MTRLFFIFSLVFGHVLSVYGAWKTILGTDLIYDSDYISARIGGEDVRIILTPTEGLYLSFLARLPGELPPGKTPNGIMLPNNHAWFRTKSCSVNNGVTEEVRLAHNTPSPVRWYDTYEGTAGDIRINTGRYKSIPMEGPPLDGRQQSLRIGFRPMDEDLKLEIAIHLSQFDYIHSIIQTSSLYGGDYDTVLKHDPYVLNANSLSMASAFRRQNDF